MINEEYVISGGSRLLLPSFVDAADLVASSGLAPVSNLQNKFRGKTWQGYLPAEVSEYDESAGAVVVDLSEGTASVGPDGSAADLSPFARTHKIVLMDSTGKTAWGYLGAASGAGCSIVTTPGGDNGWAFIQYGFDPDAISSYDLYRGLVWIDCDFGQDREVNALALVNHNLSPDARILLSLGSSQGADDVGFGVFPGWMPLFDFEHSIPHGCGGFPSDLEADRLYWTGQLRLIYLDAALKARWQRVALWDPNNGSGLIEAGRMLAGKYFSSTRMPVIGAGNSPVDPSPISYSLGGQSWKDRLPQRRDASYEFRHTPGDETYLVWYDFLRRVGTGVPFVADFFPRISNIDLRLNNLLYCELPQDAVQPVQLSHRVRGTVVLRTRESL